MTEGAANLLEGVERGGGCILDQVDVGEATLGPRSANRPRVIKAKVSWRVASMFSGCRPPIALKEELEMDKSHLAEQPEHAKAAAIDAELW